MRDPDDGNRMNVVIFARKGCARNLSNAFFPFSCRKRNYLKEREILQVDGGQEVRPIKRDERKKKVAKRSDCKLKNTLLYLAKNNSGNHLKRGETEAQKNSRGR